MDDYISRQAAIDALTIQRIQHETRDRYKKGIAQGLNFAIASLSNIPLADVRPVVRGKWEVVDWVEYDGHGECIHYPKKGLRCTNCKNAFKKELLWKDNYCPNCGADNREDNDE